ncbi:MAG: alpha/beta hydrolase [Gammaproteobacteria bacterium]|nr:alpha/beta hydrolase [Gammaproteobacteria bacterium]
MRNCNNGSTGANGAHALNYIRKINAQSGVAERIFVDTRMNLYKSSEGFQTIMNWYNDIVADIDIDIESKYVETSFGRTHMLACGEEQAPPLFLLPGIAGCAPLWRRQFAEFSKTHRVYALDIVGQPGKSETNIVSFLNDDFVQWLTDVQDELGISKADYLGNSVGGSLCMQMAVKQPDRVNSLVLLAPTGIARAKFPMHLLITKVLRKNKDTDALETEITAKTVNKSTRGNATEAGGGGGKFGTFDRQLARAMALATKHYRVDKSVGVYNESTGKVHIPTGLRVLKKFFMAEPRKVLQQIKVPTLLIFGEHEMLYKPKAIKRKAEKLLGDVQVEIVDNAGHGAIFDQPTRVNGMISEFLNNHQS